MVNILLEKRISLSLARDAARAAVEQCHANGFRVSAAVVDRAGNLKTLLGDDGASVRALLKKR